MVARRNINNLRYADDTTLMAESEELKSLLMGALGGKLVSDNQPAVVVVPQLQNPADAADEAVTE